MKRVLAQHQSVILNLVTEKTKAHSQMISSMDYAPNGKTLVSACFGGTIKVWGELPFLASTAQLPSDSALPADRCFFPGFGCREGERPQRRKG